MNDVQNKLLELKDRGWTMAAIADELDVSHMSVFRWQLQALLINPSLYGPYRATEGI